MKFVEATGQRVQSNLWAAWMGKFSVYIFCAHKSKSCVTQNCRFFSPTCRRFSANVATSVTAVCVSLAVFCSRNLKGCSCKVEEDSCSCGCGASGFIKTHRLRRVALSRSGRSAWAPGRRRLQQEAQEDPAESWLGAHAFKVPVHLWQSALGERASYLPKPFSSLPLTGTKTVAGGPWLTCAARLEDHPGSESLPDVLRLWLCLGSLLCNFSRLLPALRAPNVWARNCLESSCAPKSLERLDWAGERWDVRRTPPP